MPTFLERYVSGECVEVWDDLASLGESVRHEFYYADAVAVATETMRRARHNVELLIQRLADAGYRFVPATVEDDPTKKAEIAATLKLPPLKNSAVFDPPGNQTASQLKKIETKAGGPMPIALRAWYEQVGGVSLLGSHPVINPRDHQIPADPLAVAPLIEIIETMGFFESEDGVLLCLAADDLHKEGVSGGDPYMILIPNRGADPEFLYEWHETTFVNYLRIAFKWGGFPGWERDKNPPREAIARLTEGLLPI
jgi:hypothetical protein